MVRLTLICLAAAAVIAGCRIPGTPEPSVTNLKFVPSAFDSFRSNAELKFSLTAPATVSIRIRAGSPGGRVVRTLADDLRETKGSHAVAWLGDTDERLFAPAGIYFGVVVTGGAAYEANVQVFHY